MVASPIRAFVGPNGSGKSLAALICGVVPALRAGRPVLSNCTLRPEVIDCDPALYEPLTTWKSLVEAQGRTIWLDEITACLPSRAFASVPAELQRVLNQLRKQDCDVLWTAPNWSRADVLVREVTQEVTVCRSRWRDPWQRTIDGPVRDERGRKVRRDARWPAWRFFSWYSYAAEDYDLYQDRGSSELLKPMYRTNYWLPARKREAWVYATGDQVMLMDHLDDIGRCVGCNRPRRKEYCGCVDPKKSESGAVSVRAVVGAL